MSNDVGSAAQSRPTRGIILQADGRGGDVGRPARQKRVRRRSERGIGKAIAEEYADRGADVAAVARSSDDLEALAASLSTECVPIECDVRDDETVERAVTTAVDRLGAIDVAINSAGMIARGRFMRRARQT